MENLNVACDSFIWEITHQKERTLADMLRSMTWKRSILSNNMTWLVHTWHDWLTYDTIHMNLTWCHSCTWFMSITCDVTHVSDEWVICRIWMCHVTLLLKIEQSHVTPCVWRESCASNHIKHMSRHSFTRDTTHITCHVTHAHETPLTSFRADMTDSHMTWFTSITCHVTHSHETALTFFRVVPKITPSIGSSSFRRPKLSSDTDLFVFFHFGRVRFTKTVVSCAAMRKMAGRTHPC